MTTDLNTTVTWQFKHTLFSLFICLHIPWSSQYILDPPPSGDKYPDQCNDRIYSVWISVNHTYGNTLMRKWIIVHLFNIETSVRTIGFSCAFLGVCFLLFFSFFFCFVCEIMLKKFSEKHFVSWQVILSSSIMKWIFLCQTSHS